MNQIKRIIKALDKKYRDRIKRAKVVAQAAPELTAAEAKAMVDDQVAAIKLWTRDEVIREFCDPEELVIRGILKRYSD